MMVGWELSVDHLYRAEQKASMLEAQLDELEAKLDAFMAEYGILDEEDGEKDEEGAETPAPTANGHTSSSEKESNNKR